MKIIHLASFNGNVGDMINHIGFYNNIRKYVTSDITIKQIEIRNYYRSWNEAAFDQNFIDMVNDGDLFVVGGGDFFRIEWDYSLTGTTFNIQNELLIKLIFLLFLMQWEWILLTEMKKILLNLELF